MATIPGLVLSNKQNFPDAVALRYKQLGIWSSYSWEDYYDEVASLVDAYKNLSVSKGTVVAIYGNNIPKLIFSIAAVQTLGGIVALIHPESNESELTTILNSSKAEVLIAEDQQQVDTFLKVESECNINTVVYLDGRGMSNYENSKLNSYDDMVSKSANNNIDAQMQSVTDNDIAFYLYDEHENKIYKVSHDSIIRNSSKICDLNKLSNKDSIVSYLPLSISTNLLFTYITSLVSGMSFNLPESNQTIEKDLQEIGPTILYAPSFVFKHIISSISYRIESASESNYQRYMWHYTKLMQIYDKEVSGNKNLIDTIWKAWIMLTTFAPAKNVFGLTKIKHAFVSDGVLSKVNFNFFHAIGVEIQHSFGQAISCGCISVQPDHSVSSENVGAPMSGAEVKISDNSEVYFKTDCLGEDIDGGTNSEDGWINSGYVGSIDESGNLIINGRSEDIVTMKSGKKYSPESVENLISCSPFIKSTVVIGNNQDSNSAIIVIDPNSVNSWADRKNIRYTGYAELAGKDEVRNLIMDHIKCVNETLDAELKVKKFVILHRTLIMNAGEVSKTMEVMRKNISKNLSDVFSAIENNESSIKVNDIDQLSYELKVNDI